MNIEELLKINILLYEEKYQEIYDIYGEDNFFNFIKHIDHPRILLFIINNFKIREYIYMYALTHIRSFNHLTEMKDTKLVGMLVNSMYHYNDTLFINMIKQYNFIDSMFFIINKKISKYIENDIYEIIFNTIYKNINLEKLLIFRVLNNREKNYEQKFLYKLSLCIKDILKKEPETLLTDYHFINFILNNIIKVKFINNKNINLFKKMIDDNQKNIISLLNILIKCEKPIEYIEDLICQTITNDINDIDDINFYYQNIKHVFNAVQFKNKDKIYTILKLKGLEI